MGVVGYNQLTEEAALSIVRVEQQRNKLTSLGLSKCKIGPIGAKEIAEWISVSRVLTTLNLWGNRIGDEGAAAIAKALDVNAVLTKLDLRYTLLDEKSEKLLHNAVRSRGNLKLEL